MFFNRNLPHAFEPWNILLLTENAITFSACTVESIVYSFVKHNHFFGIAKCSFAETRKRSCRFYEPLS